MRRSIAAMASAVLALSACQSNPKATPSLTAAGATPAAIADSPTQSTATPFVEPNQPLLTNRHQLTVAGSRAGEGYFSADGRYMIFQSEREPGNPFYQQYVLDLRTGLTTRVSPGYGKTTCGWIHPNNKVVLFASTHGDPEWKKKAEQELEQRKNPKSRYSWNFDENYDIYQTDMDGRHIRNLTHVKGYDAEGSYSPDGQWIAFASNRAAYDGSMTAEQANLFAKDPSYMMDLYIMRADGSEVKRLTSDPGYDGGPFFSPDGRRLVYRHFTADGRTAEVYSMNVDGSDRRQLTHIGAMSWAPFYHPSGDYIIFASNKFGHANFELFIVDTEGLHEPIRATELEGFDGLPVFTPDGKTLVWAHSPPRGEAQLYRADWNDALARQLLGLRPKVPTEITPMAWVQYLADPYFGGRPTGGTREVEYSEALAGALRGLGLEPAAGESFVQNYTFTSGLELGDKNSLQLHTGKEDAVLQTGKDWIPLSFAKTGRFERAPLVFAGYGMSVSAAGAQPAYDSYADLNVKDKWVVVFSGMPEDISAERRFFLNLYTRLHNKALTARQRGARGLIVVEDTTTPTPEMKINFEGRNEDAGLPVLRLSVTAADRLFAAAKTSRQDWSRRLASGAVAGFAFPGALALSADIDLKFKTSEAHNVVALLKAPGATGTVIVGAHMDHLGRGEQGNSLAADKTQIHPGADDNASGVATVLATAKELTQRVRSRAFTPKQNILIGFWSGEEIGILGSSQFANSNSKFKLTASLNLDMVGHYRDTLHVQGLGSAPQWPSLVEKVNVTAGTPLILQTQMDPYLPSDALTFYMKQVPSIMLFTGSHAQYHTPQDTPAWINADGMNQIAVFAERLTEALAGSPNSPVTYQKVEGTPGKGRSESGLRLYLGTIPDYTRESNIGVAISGTSKGSPAEQAGLLAGDLIVELGGIKIKNLQDYVYCLQSLKAGEKTKIRLVRAGHEKELDITPANKVQR